MFTIELLRMEGFFKGMFLEVTFGTIPLRLWYLYEALARKGDTKILPSMFRYALSSRGQCRNYINRTFSCSL